MKKINFLLVALILQLLSFSIPVQHVQAQDVAVSYQTFYDQLAPYGQWVNDGEYGNVWVPNVEPGFRPYATDGHWVMTDQGNMWASDVPWAWACYHYGRWTYNGYYGWVWIPGYEWAPAWVVWRSGRGYYGWAPMGPGHEFGGVYEYPENYWVFVNPNYLYHPNVYTYYERGDAGYYYRQTSYVRYEGRDHYYYGPRREEIERETHHPVEVYRVSNAREAGEAHMGRNEMSIYRPSINRETEHSARPANVMEGRDHPIGRPEPISANHATSQPAFRQEHVQQHQEMQQQQHQSMQQQQHQQMPQQQPQQHQQMPQQQPQQHQQMPQQQPQQHQQMPQQQPQQHQQMPQQQPQQHQQMPQPQQHQQPPQQPQQHQQMPQQQPQQHQQMPQQHQQMPQQQQQHQQMPQQHQQPSQQHQQQKPQPQPKEH